MFTILPMKQYFTDKNSDSLILFFAGWACDEFEFQHLKSKCDVLILYDYQDLNFKFDFSKYSEINIFAFSAGVFVSSVVVPKLKIKSNRTIAISGNPYLFDEYFGLSKEMIKIFRSITEENAPEFARNYLVMTDEEFNSFESSKRTLESSIQELDSLFEIYKKEKDNIKDIFDTAVIGDFDPIFKATNQKEFYKSRLKIIKNARHNIFFRIKSFEDIFEI